MSQVRHKMTAGKDEYFYYSFGRDSSFFAYRPLVVKMNAQREEQWFVDFKFKLFKRINALTVADNGDVIAVGANDRWIEGELNRVGWVFRISAEGRLKWEHEIIERRNNAWIGRWFSDVEEQDDGAIFIVGSIEDTIGHAVPNANTWVVRLDSNGLCHGDNCPEIEILYTSVHDEVRQDEKVQELRLYPNPTAGSFSIENSTGDVALVSLYAMDGMMKYAWRVLDTGVDDITLDLPDLASAKYLIVAQDKKGHVLAEGRLVVVEE